ncbi:hypothetical protein COY62_02705 [bacterium (Candidatus Howlettbacteria) CG_4_10_14_0_8_um_filter_40_9]|nr:MAG: hypothetical protein COY62_02705 [bacterium (Candidatus Howlettbacteria) CG_4_10_14_0_8_um_filter_40_9]
MDEQKNIEIEQKNLTVPTGEVEHAQPPEGAEVQETVVVPQEMPSQVSPPPTVPDSTNIQQPVQAPVVPIQNDPLSQTAAPVDDGLDAEEGNIIEKPWVKKAEDIIDKNKDNPYEEEEKQEDLQIEYLKKRFGKEIKKEEEG